MAFYQLSADCFLGILSDDGGFVCPRSKAATSRAALFSASLKCFGRMQAVFIFGSCVVTVCCVSVLLLCPLCVLCFINYIKRHNYDRRALRTQNSHLWSLVVIAIGHRRWIQPDLVLTITSTLLLLSTANHKPDLERTSTSFCSLHFSAISSVSTGPPQPPFSSSSASFSTLFNCLLFSVSALQRGPKDTSIVSRSRSVQFQPFCSLFLFGLLSSVFFFLFWPHPTHDWTRSIWIIHTVYNSDHFVFTMTTSCLTFH